MVFDLLVTLRNFYPVDDISVYLAYSFLSLLSIKRSRSLIQGDPFSHSREPSDEPRETEGPGTPRVSEGAVEIVELLYFYTPCSKSSRWDCCSSGSCRCRCFDWDYRHNSGFRCCNAIDLPSIQQFSTSMLTVNYLDEVGSGTWSLELESRHPEGTTGCPASCVSTLFDLWTSEHSLWMAPNLAVGARACVLVCLVRHPKVMLCGVGWVD